MPDLPLRSTSLPPLIGRSVYTPKTIELITLHRLPTELSMHFAGIVAARSVKLLQNKLTQVGACVWGGVDVLVDLPLCVCGWVGQDQRNYWWQELRDEVNSQPSPATHTLTD